MTTPRPTGPRRSAGSSPRRPTRRLPAAPDERRPAQQLHQRGGAHRGDATCAGSATTTRSSPSYVSRVLDVFAEDERRVVVTTQIVYTDADGAETLDTDYDPTALASADPVVRLRRDAPAADQRLRDARPALRDDAPRRSPSCRDGTCCARTRSSPPGSRWPGRGGTWPAPLAGRRREEGTASGLARLLGVPGWRRHVRVILQCRELSHWVGESSLDPAQRRRAQAEILRFYARGKQIKARRGVAKLERSAGRPVRLSPSGAR